MKLTVLISLALLHASLLSADSFEFRGLRFGDSPGRNMTCIRGNCPAGSTAFFAGTDFPHAVYIFNEGVTTITGVPISVPEYDFFEGQLYRIRLNLKCDSKYALACIESVMQEFSENYGFTVVSEQRGDDPNLGPVLVIKGHTESGDEVVISWSPEFSRKRYPHIDFQNHGLIEKVRMASNPNYAGGR